MRYFLVNLTMKVIQLLLVVKITIVLYGMIFIQEQTNKDYKSYKFV